MSSLLIAEIMTPKEQLLKAIEITPESTLIEVLDFLNLLNARQNLANTNFSSQTNQTSTLPPKNLDFTESTSNVADVPPTDQIAIMRGVDGGERRDLAHQGFGGRSCGG